MIKKITRIQAGELYVMSGGTYFKIGDVCGSADHRHYYARFDEKQLEIWKDKIPSQLTLNTSGAVKDIIEDLNYMGYELVVDKPKKEEYSLSVGLFNIDDL